MAVALVFAAGVVNPTSAQELLQPNPSIHGTLNVWGWNIAAASLINLIPSFNERYPNVKVDVVTSGTAMQSRFLLSLAANVGAPDVSQLQMYDAPRFSPSGRLLDLTERAKKYEGQFSPAFWQACLHENRIYAIPWDMGPCAVFYKRDLFAKYHVDPDAIETWADYIEVGKRIVRESNGKTMMMALSVGWLFDMFEILMQQNGGGVFDPEGRIIINSPQNLEALEVLRALLDSKITAAMNPFSHEFYASMSDDSIASYPMAVWFGGSARDYTKGTAGNWGVFRLPAIQPGGLRNSNLGGSVLVIPEQCPQPDAAWAFIEYVLCNKQAQLEQYRKFDLFPCLMTTFDDPFFDEPDPFYGGQKVRRLFATDIEKIPPLTRTSDWNEARRYVMQALTLWAGDRTDSGEFLAHMESRLHRKLGRAIATPETR
ncbi:MAG: sugar ABC transporter substrate-binding protein [Candidatus Hydrogenedentes bacterium]|nr:sugar ABC transporter substrate-binding protein [Candidatus Hydrogenedentota bacterium]